LWCVLAVDNFSFAYRYNKYKKKTGFQWLLLINFLNKSCGLKRIKIAYITGADPRDKRSWSGVHYYVWKALERNIGEVDLLGPAEDRFRLFLCRIVHGFALYVLGKRFNYRHSVFMSKGYARLFSKKLAAHKYDLIVAPGGAAYIAYLKTDIPIFYFSDATNANLLGYRLMLSNLLEFSRRQSLLIEQRAIDKATFLSYSSDWAIQSALHDFKAKPEKTCMLPFGANLDPAPQRIPAMESRQTEVCRLFFLGVDWNHKGGPVAFDTLLELEKMGIPAELTVVGCTVPPEFTHPGFKTIGFLNKNNEAEFRELEKLYLDSSFFLLPTKLECYGICFCEAAAYGLPCIAGNSGGVSSSIAEGKSGFLLPEGATGKDYALVIAKIWKNPVEYKALQQTSRELFEQSRNWDAWANSLKSRLLTDSRFQA
jgi:glycosyltransferase involved in cell wall biosynthesis